jgi:hypothetical protein
MSISGLKLSLVGEDGNAFSILGRAQKVLRKGGKGDLLNEFMEKAMSGDYDNLLHTCMEYFDCDEGEEEDEY